MEKKLLSGELGKNIDGNKQESSQGQEGQINSCSSPDLFAAPDPALVSAMPTRKVLRTHSVPPGDLGPLFRPGSIPIPPREPSPCSRLSLCLSSCNSVHTWPGYMLSWGSSYIPKLAMTNYTQHFQYAFLFGAEKPKQISFSPRCNTALGHGGAVKVLLPFSGLWRRLRCCSVRAVSAPPFKSSSLELFETRVILYFFLELVRFLFQKEVAAETTLNHPCLHYL